MRWPLVNVGSPVSPQSPIMTLLRSATRTGRRSEHVQCPRDRLRVFDCVVYHAQLFHDRGPATSEHPWFLQAPHLDVDRFYWHGTLGRSYRFRTEERRRGS